MLATLSVAAASPRASFWDESAASCSTGRLAVARPCWQMPLRVYVSIGTDAHRRWLTAGSLISASLGRFLIWRHLTGPGLAVLEDLSAGDRLGHVGRVRAARARPLQRSQGAPMRLIQARHVQLTLICFSHHAQCCACAPGTRPVPGVHRRDRRHHAQAGDRAARDGAPHRRAATHLHGR